MILVCLFVGLPTVLLGAGLVFISATLLLDGTA